MADRLGDGLEQAEGRRFDDRADRLVDGAVVDRLASGRRPRRPAAGSGPARRRPRTAGSPAARGRSSRGDPRSACSPGRSDRSQVPLAVRVRVPVPRTIASVMRAARTFAWTSWTRTTSAPRRDADGRRRDASPRAARRPAGPGPGPASTCGSCRAGSAGPGRRRCAELAQERPGCARPSCRTRIRDRRSVVRGARPSRTRALQRGRAGPRRSPPSRSS